MRKTLLAVAALALAGTTALAQASQRRPEIRPFAGALIATGDQRSLFDNGAMFGLQAALEMNPNVHLVTTFGYSALKSRYGVADRDASILQYDAGVEFGLVRPLPGDWEFKPFIGGGVGGRSYIFQASTLRNRSCTLGYGTLGTEFQVSQLALRLEGRDNLFCYHSPLAPARSTTRNDVSISFGLAYHIR